MSMKIFTKKAAEKMKKQAMTSSNFCLDGGNPESNHELDEFIKKRFNSSSLQNILLTKEAQYNFRRTDLSPEEYHGTVDLQMFSYPGSLMELLLPETMTIISKEDEESLYSIWEKANNDNKGFLNVSKGDIYKAEKLMNRGYVIASDGKYQLTEKGRKVLIGKILGTKPTYKWDLGKTSAFEGDSKYVIRGTEIVLFNPTFTQEKEYAIIQADPSVVRKIQTAGLFSPEKVQWVNRNLLAIPMSIVEEDRGASVFPYVSDEGQIFGHQSPGSNSPWANKPIGKEEIPVMSGFSSSKVFGLLKESSRIGCNSVKERCIAELKSRGLNVRTFAYNDAEREKGLMHSEPLKDNECALFMFNEGENYLGDSYAQYCAPKEDIRRNPGFWNKNVSFPIDVAFYDPDGILIAVKQLEANQLEPVFSGCNDVRYVIETQKDWYKKNNIKNGSTIYQVVEVEFRDYGQQPPSKAGACLVTDNASVD